MSRATSPEDRVAGFLIDGPSRGPDAGLADALARTRATHQRPRWIVAFRGGVIDPPWPVPSMPSRAAFVLLVALLAAAALAGAVVGSGLLRSTIGPQPGEGQAAALAFSLLVDGNDDLHVARADGSELRRVTSGAEQEFAPSFSPDGRRIAFYENPGDGTYVLRLVDASGPRTLATGLGCFTTGHAPTWTPDGRFLVFPRVVSQAACDDVRLDLAVVPVDEAETPRRLLASSFTGFSSSPAWSPDGRRLAFHGVVDGVAGLWIVEDVDPEAPWGLVPRLIASDETYSPLAWTFPRWSPDGRTIAVTVLPRAEPPYRAVVLVDPDGSRERLLWPSATSDHGVPEWLPDGIHVAVTETPGVGAQTAPLGLRIIDSRTGAQVPVDAPPVSGYHVGPRVSPDGARVVAWTPDKSSLLVITLDGGAPVVSFPGAGDASWQPMPAPLDWAPLVSLP